MPPLATATTRSPSPTKADIDHYPSGHATLNLTNCSTPPGMGNSLNIGGGINLTRDTQLTECFDEPAVNQKIGWSDLGVDGWHGDAVSTG